MAVPPKHCKVLVAGGGPGGSYAATVLAREGVDVVLLESDQHPRYHIGESLLPSTTTFLKFIDLFETFDQAGFKQKLGATFKLTQKKNAAFTDFMQIHGPKGYSWNVVRSQSDELLFRHAAKSGAKAYENIALKGILFEPLSRDQEQFFTQKDKLANPGRPVAAEWSSKSGQSGIITFDYLIDATGRAGVMSTKYLKNRNFNGTLKNLAVWGYYEGAKVTEEGTRREGQPYFEGMKDGSGWTWSIPLHDGRLSVGAVLRQDIFQAKKQQLGDSFTQKDMLEACLELSPNIANLLRDAKLVTDVKQASDYSYNASAYAGPYFRLVGDAACFIDPLFSSGNHLAMSSGLSAAVSIMASIKGEATEAQTASYHSKKLTQGYTLFLFVVLAALQQIRNQNISMLGAVERNDFDFAFEIFKPIIQGGSDNNVHKGFTNEQVAKTFDFCSDSIFVHGNEDPSRVMKLAAEVGKQVKQSGSFNDINNYMNKDISEEDVEIVKGLMIVREVQEFNDFRESGPMPVDGLVARLKRGNLGLSRVKEDPPKADVVHNEALVEVAVAVGA